MVSTSLAELVRPAVQFCVLLSQMKRRPVLPYITIHKSKGLEFMDHQIFSENLITSFTLDTTSFPGKHPRTAPGHKICRTLAMISIPSHDFLIAGLAATCILTSSHFSMNRNQKYQPIRPVSLNQQKFSSKLPSVKTQLMLFFWFTSLQPQRPTVLPNRRQIHLPPIIQRLLRLKINIYQKEKDRLGFAISD